MQSLLRWSIENSDGTVPPPDPSQNKSLDPAIIDMILGKPDAEQMKEDLAAAMDETRSEDERVNALDHLEMLIEHIDNANDLEKLKMWEPLQSLLISPSSTPDIKMHTLWVIGTALQNNPAAQRAYLNYSPLPVLTSFLTPSPASTPAIRSKVIYALSGLLKHNAVALQALDAVDLDGWTVFKDALQDPDISVRRKIVFLLNTLILPTSPESSSTQSNSSQTSISHHEPVHSNSHASMLADPSSTATSPLALQAIRDHGILSSVVSGLVNPVPYGEDGDQLDLDLDFEEKAVRLLHTYADTCQCPIPEANKSPLKGWIADKERSEGGHDKLAEKWGFSNGELQTLKDAVS